MVVSNSVDYFWKLTQNLKYTHFIVFVSPSTFRVQDNPPQQLAFQLLMTALYRKLGFWPPLQNAVTLGHSIFCPFFHHVAARCQ